MPFSFSWWHHKKCRNMTFISWRKVLGSKKILIVYVGIDCATAFKRIFFLACERNLFFQLLILLQILSLIDVNATQRAQPTRAGRPKYFSKQLVAWTSEANRMWFWTLVDVFRLKKIEVLSLFSRWPKACSNVYSRDCSCDHSIKLAL